MGKERTPDASILLAVEAQVLEMLSSGMPLQQLLESLCLMVERQCGEQSRCSILILDQDERNFRLGAAPGLPPAYATVIDGMSVDPMLSPFGAAAHFDRPVIVTDIASDSLCRNLRNTAEQLGLSACWSTPIHSRGGKVLGTFTTYHTDTLAPDQRQLEFIERAACLASIAVEQSRDADKLRVWAKLFEASHEAIMITNNEAGILYINEAFIRTTGYTLEEVRGHDPRMLSSGRHSQEFYQQMWAELNTRGEWSGEIWNRRKNGEIYPEWLSITSVRNDAGKVLNYIAIFADISESKMADEKIRHLAHHDFLTGLPNRGLLDDRLSHAVAAAQRKRNKVAVLFIDLDRFKLVNETLGHEVGDSLLQEVSARIRKSLRESDTVCRQGGDEFIVILPDIVQATDAAYAAEKLIDSVLRPCMVMGHELRTSPSVGISIYPDDTENIELLVNYANTAMCHAKEKGRDNFQFFTQSLDARATERHELEYALRQAVQNNELTLYYQPQIEAVSGRLIGAEALVRWMHPAMGMVMPGEFIPVAEESGLIIDIGTWVLHEACRQSAAWQKAGLPPITVAVNLAGQQFRQVDLPRRIAEVLSVEGLAPQWLELEVTESSLTENLASVTEMLETLHGMGLSIAIDDFGTGFSSLAYLKRFPLHRLKIAQAFVLNIGTKPDDWEIVNAVIGIAKSLHLRVIAEGVETEHQLEMLRDRGCDEIQGYLFGQPVPGAEFELLLREKPV
jgi:diguanylate cyclase (GGDEF)-like protein/PAS domain S-box-containing protein